MSDQHSPESVYKTFQEIAAGHYTNAHFSHADVVMVSKEHYAMLCTAWELFVETDDISKEK